MYQFKFGVSETLTAFQRTASAGFESMRKVAGAFGQQTALLPRSIKQIEDRMRSLKTAQDSALKVADIRRYGSEIKQLEGQLAKLRGESVKTGSSLSGMVPALGLTGLGYVANDMMTVAREAEGISRAMSFASGSEAEFAKNTKLIEGTTSQLGVKIDVAQDGFKKLASGVMGSGISMDQTRNIFTGMMSASTALAMNNDSVQRSFSALSKMASSGTLQMDELRSELGEALPGAMSIAARSMGITVTELGKMTEQGKIMTADFLPKFAAELQKTFGGEAQKSAQSATANWNRYTNAMYEAKKVFGESVLPLFLKFASDYLVPGLKWLKDHKDRISQLASVFWTLGQRVVVVYYLSKLVSGAWALWQAFDFNKIAGKIGDIAISIWGAAKATWSAIRAVALWGVQVSLWAGRGIVRMAQFGISTLLSGNLLAGLSARFKWSAIVSGLMAMRGAASGFLFTAIPGFLGWVAGLSLATINQWLLNAAMYANPIGLVILGIAALVAAFYGLYKLIDWLMPGVWDSVVGVFKSIWDWIKKWFIDPLVGFFKWLADGLGLSMPSMEAGAEASTKPEAGGQLEKDLANLNKDFNVSGAGVGGGSSKDKGSSGEAASVSGGNRPSTIIMNIQALVKDLNISTMKLDMSEAQIKDLVTRALMGAVNDAQLGL